MNIIAWLEFELAYYNSTVQHEDTPGKAMGWSLSQLSLGHLILKGTKNVLLCQIYLNWSYKGDDCHFLNNQCICVHWIPKWFSHSINNWFSDDEVIFQDNNASYHRTTGVKASLLEKYIKSMVWTINSLNLNKKKP